MRVLCTEQGARDHVPSSERLSFCERTITLDSPGQQRAAPARTRTLSLPVPASTSFATCMRTGVVPPLMSASSRLSAVRMSGVSFASVISIVTTEIAVERMSSVTFLQQTRVSTRKRRDAT